MPKKVIPALLLSFLPLISFAEKEQEIYAYDKAGNVGANPISPGSGNLQREVLDLETFGNSPVEFKRLYRSRNRNYGAKAWELGAANTWQHNWAWELRDIDYKENGFHNLRLNTPEGETIDFKATDDTGMIRAPGLSRGDRLYQWKPAGELKNGHTLATPEGWEYYFERRAHPNYALVGVRDPQGQMWELEYDEQNRLVRIQNRFGRFINLERQEVNGEERITQIESSDGREVNYNYNTFSNATVNTTVLTSVNYPGGEQANYNYVGGTSLTEGRPLLESADDPMVEGAGSRIRWVYNYQPQFGAGRQYMVVGMAQQERNLLTDDVIVSFPFGAGNESWVEEGDGTGTYRKFFNGKLVEKVDGEGRSEQISYSHGGHGFISKRLYANGAEINYQRDAQGRVIQQRDAYGSRHYTYNANGFLLTSTDELGRILTIERNAEDLPTQKTYPDGTAESWTYNSDNQILTHTSRNGAVTSYTYYNGEAGGQFGDLKTITDALGNITTYTHNAAGNLLTETDALNRITTYSYNNRGKLLSVIYPDGSQISKAYDTYGNVIQKQNELGFITSYTYDEYNRLVTITDPEGAKTLYQYGKVPDCSSCSGVQTISKIMEPGDREIHYFYDKSGNRTQQILGANTAEAAITSYKYDSVNNLIGTTDPKGNTTSQTYDLTHKLLTRTDPLGHITSYTYDLAGNLTTETRANGTITTYAYDTMDRLITMTDANNEVTQMTYDNADNLINLTDAKNNTYTYAYDLFNRRTSLTYPDNSQESWTYNQVGSLQTYTARNGATRTCTYDLRDRELTCDWSDATADVTKTYDAAGRLTNLDNPNSQLNYSYDNANRLLSESQAINGLPAAYTIQYSYQPNGNLQNVTYPNGTIASYTYTARNQIEQILNNGLLTVTYQYDLSGNRTQKALANTITTAYSYDPANQPTQLNHQTLGQFDYGYNAVGNRTYQKRDNALGDTYQYDSIGQLTDIEYDAENVDTQSTNAQHNAQYTYDPVGNRTQAYQPLETYYNLNNLNQYTEIEDPAQIASYQYDLNGNLTSITSDADLLASYHYDSQNRLLSVSNATAQITFTYDARNRCTSRTLNGTTTYYLYEGWNLIEERDVAGSELTSYLYGVTIDEILTKTDSTNTIYYHHDALGNVTHLSDNTGRLLEKYRYDAYGRVTFYGSTNQPLTASSYGNRFLFTGREWIQEAGLYDYRNRIYSPSLGRFLQTDPIGFGAGDVNLYRYVENNPINSTDSLGLQGGPGSATTGNYIVGGAIGAYNFLKFKLSGGNKKRPDYDKKVHCVTSCQITKATNKQTAENLGNLKERMPGPGQNDAADQQANKDGRECAGDPSGCECCCEKKGH